MAWSKTRNADETLFIFGIQDLGHTDQQFGQSVMSENGGFGWGWWLDLAIYEYIVLDYKRLMGRQN